MYTDTLADLLTRIRNGHHAHKETIAAPSSKMKLEVVKILHEEGFIGSYKVEQIGNHKTIIILLKYNRDSEPAIRNIRRVSRPGFRVYRGYRDLKPVLNGLGIGIVSTSAGIVTDKVAREKKLGGELICTIY